MWEITDEHLDLAQNVVEVYLQPTALVPATAIHPNAWTKLENTQMTRSFKVRGALTKIASLARAERNSGVVTASAGNHGLGVALAGKIMGVGVRVFVPKNVPPVKRDGIAGLGAEVVVSEEPGYDAVEREAIAWGEQNGATFVSAYDDPWVAAGNGGTLGLEIFAAMPSLSAVIAPVGGGGLMAGLVAARARSERTDVRLIGVNTAASPGMYRSLSEGRAIEELPPAETLAEGLEGGVRESTFQIARDADVEMHVVEEEAIRDAMRFSEKTLGQRIEGSAAVGVALARTTDIVSASSGPVLIILTGGNV